MALTALRSVFISYARRDSSSVAVRLKSGLEDAGAGVWLDRVVMVAGDGWTEAIEHAIFERRWNEFIKPVERHVERQRQAVMIKQDLIDNITGRIGISAVKVEIAVEVSGRR